MSQHMDALAKGNRIRYAQAAVMREIRASNGTGKQLCADHLRDPSEIVGSIRLDRLLRSVPRYGPTRVRKMLSDQGLPPVRLTRRVRELSDRERNTLANALTAKSERPTTKRQREILEALDGDWLTATQVGWKVRMSSGSAVQHLLSLHRRGLVERRPGKRSFLYRSIESTVSKSLPRDRGLDRRVAA